MTNTILLCYIKDGGVMFNTLQNTFLDFFGEQNDIKEMSAREFYNSLDKNSLNNIIVTYYILSKNEEDLKDYIGYKPKKSENKQWRSSRIISNKSNINSRSGRVYCNTDSI